MNRNRIPILVFAFVLGGTLGATVAAGPKGGAMRLIARQGGDAVQWHVTGTTNYPVDGARIQAGSFAVPGWNWGEHRLTFPEPFAAPPIVIVTPVDQAGMIPYVWQVDEAGCTLGIIRHDGLVYDCTVHWIAIGP